MVSKSTVVNALPMFRNKRVLITNLQDTDDIIKEILLAHNDYAADYDKIYQYFDTGDIDATSRTLFDFLKRNVPYTKESSDFQTVKSPAAILQPGETVDCKNYSLFIAGVLDSIKRNTGDVWTWKYRYASYNNDPEPAHVFVVVNDGNKEIWIDPVLTHYNQRKMPTYQTDRKPKSIAGLYQISGPNDCLNGSSGSVSVEKSKSIQSFLIAVNLNLFSLRDLLMSDPAILYGPVKRYFIANRFPFETLIALLQNGKKQK
jgi:hypothetical protein